MTECFILPVKGCLFLGFFCPTQRTHAHSEEVSVADGGGGPQTNAQFSGVGVIGQGTPLGLTANPAKNNYPITPTDPLLSDSDGDGASDGSESVAGTNPHDTNNLLEIVRLDLTGGMGVVEWKNRGGKEYEVHQASSVDELLSSPTVLGTFMATGGTGAWFETTSTSTNAMPGTNAFYGVRVMP